MARIAGIDLPREKRIEVGIRSIYGIGPARSKEILAATGLILIRVRDLTDDEVNRLRDYIDKNIKVEGDLRREVSLNIKRLIEIGCYRGIRHRKGACPCADRAPSRTRAPAKVPRRLLRARRKSKGGLNKWQSLLILREACAAALKKRDIERVRLISARPLIIP